MIEISGAHAPQQKGSKMSGGYGELVGDDVLVGDGIIGDDEYSGALMYSGDEIVGDDEWAGADPDVAALMAGDDDFAGAVRRRPLPPRGRPAMRPNVGLAQAQRQALARVQHQQAQRAAFAQRERNFVMQRGNPMLVRTQSPDRKLKLPAGFSASAVAAGASTTIQVEPQCLFRADELVIPETYGANFVITELAIGQIRLIVGAGAVSALVFSEKTLRPITLDWPTNQVTQKILLIATNISAGAATLYGMFYGRAAI